MLQNQQHRYMATAETAAMAVAAAVAAERLSFTMRHTRQKSGAVVMVAVTEEKADTEALGIRAA